MVKLGPMDEQPVGNPQDSLLHAMRGAILAEVRQEQADFTLRQLAVVLTVYLTEEPQTVRGLAQHLAISKPAITRAFDRLEALDILRRQVEPGDRRGVFAARTKIGADMVARLGKTFCENLN
jgi:DNA-binding MarR family transcriptional regulator